MSPFEEDPVEAKPPAREKPSATSWGRAVAFAVILLCLVYLFYANSQFKKEMRSEMARLEDRVQALKESGSLSEASLSGQILGLKEEMDAMRVSSPSR